VIDVSVVVVSYNTKDLLVQCLKALSEALTSIQHEVIVVDNGSADGSADAVEKGFPRLRLIRNRDNSGFARACNQGLRTANGKYLLLLNPDAIISQEALSGMIHFMEKTPNAGAAGVQLVREDGSLQNSFDNIPDLGTELLNKSLLKRLLPNRYPGKHLKFTGPVEVESLIGACMMVPREVIDTAGFLDEGYFFFLEETDWCLRMTRKGWKIYFLPDLRVVHLQGQSARQDPASARIEFYRSRYRFFALHKSMFSRGVLRMGLIFNLCVEILYSFLASLITGFSYRKEVSRLHVRVKILAWHLLGCPDDWGIKRTGQEDVRES
jgi:hypothetical protein